MSKRFKLIAALGVSAALVAGIAWAKPSNGDMGIYVDTNGNITGTWVMSCEGVLRSSGTPGKMIANGSLFCNAP